MALVVGALAFHALCVSPSPEYRLRGGVGDIYPPCTLNLVNLALLNHYPKFIDLIGIIGELYDINMSTSTPTFSQGGQLSLLLHSGRLTGALRG